MPASRPEVLTRLFPVSRTLTRSEVRRVRLQPRTTVEAILSNGSRIAMIAIGLIVTAMALNEAETILAPVFLGIILGMMLTPIARGMERAGLPPAASAALVLLLFVIGVIGVMAALALPLTTWIARLPAIWDNLRDQLTDMRGLFGTIGAMREQISGMMGEVGGVLVRVDDGLPIESAAWLGPTLAAEAMLLFASLYFFVATRDRIRIAVLSVSMSRRLRWRLAHVFRDIELLVSRYLLTITIINAGFGASVGMALFLVGTPSPILWGVMAAVLNYVTYVGPAIMVVVLASVGLATSDGTGVIVPALVYLVLNVIESQFITAHVLGRTMTLNPFLVFLALVFWIWLWGPVGGFIAVPSLLILHAVIRNVTPLADAAKGGRP